MKKLFNDAMLRGMVGAGYGPLVLAVFYLILQNQGLAQTLTVNEVCLGIFSLSALAFVAGAINGIYQIEQLPLMVAIIYTVTIRNTADLNEKLQESRQNMELQ